MIKISKQKILLGSTALLASMAFTAVSTTSADEKNISYVAHGTTDIKTAKMFQILLKNSRELEVQTKVNTPSKYKQPQYNLGVTYTVTGKTSVRNARKLIKLFKDSKHIQVNVDVVRRTNHQVASKQNHPKPLSLYTANYPAVYMQVGNNPNGLYPNSWYPVTLYKPVPVLNTEESSDKRERMVQQ